MTDSPDPHDDARVGLMTIGQFSALARISVRMLRHYDKHAVLIPAEVDGCTGYRCYSGDQLEQAMVIRNLRDVGFGVSAIGALLASRGTPAHAQALAMQRAVLEQELRAARERLILIDRLVTDEQEYPVDITIGRKAYPAQTVVSLRDVIPDYQSEGKLWERLLPELSAQGIEVLPGGGATNHDEGFRDADVDTSVWVPVPSGTTVREPLQVVQHPEQTVEVAVLRGPLSGIGQAVDHLARHLTQQGIRPTGPLSTRYVTDPSCTDPEEQVTELFFSGS